MKNICDIKSQQGDQFTASNRTISRLASSAHCPVQHRPGRPAHRPRPHRRLGQNRFGNVACSAGNKMNTLKSGTLGSIHG